MGFHDRFSGPKPVDLSSDVFFCELYITMVQSFLGRSRFQWITIIIIIIIIIIVIIVVAVKMACMMLK